MRCGICWIVLLLGQTVTAHEPAQPAVPPRRVPAAEAHWPTPLPDRVILTVTADPARSASVTWRTDTSVEVGLARIAQATPGPGFDPRWGRMKAKKSAIHTVTARTEKLKTDLNEVHCHSVTFEGLLPSTTYVYRVGDGVNWSEWFQFRTAALKSEPFSFVYFGDAQNDLKAHWSRVIRQAVTDAPKAAFMLHAGDLVNSGGSDAEWGEWFQAGGWLHSQIPSVPVTGNHEYGSDGLTKHWRAQFTLPENGPPGLEESAYFFDYQGARIVALNSNEQRQTQVEWLDRILGNCTQRWLILSFHHPIYSAAVSRDNRELRELWKPIIEKYKVDLVLTGHDHTYGRGVAPEQNIPTGLQLHTPTGPVYVVSVSGPKMYTLEPLKWMQRSGQDTQLYQIIRINGERLEYEARTATGELYDSFSLTARDHQPGRGPWGLLGLVTVAGLLLALRARRGNG